MRLRLHIFCFSLKFCGFRCEMIQLNRLDYIPQKQLMHEPAHNKNMRNGCGERNKLESGLKGSKDLNKSFFDSSITMQQTKKRHWSKSAVFILLFSIFLGRWLKGARHLNVTDLMDYELNTPDTSVISNNIIFCIRRIATLSEKYVHAIFCFFVSTQYILYFSISKPPTRTISAKVRNFFLGLRH